VYAQAVLISHALSKAVEDIDRCLEAYPECYGSMTDRIKAVRESMDDLRNEIDQNAAVSGQEIMLHTAGRV
jgi:hypothetical protein